MPGTDHEGITLSEVKQTEKDKYCVISLTCRIERNQTHREGDEICSYQNQGPGDGRIG